MAETMANLKLTVGPWPVKLVTWAACVTVTCLVQLEIKANEVPFAIVPTDQSACFGDFAIFKCSSQASTSRLFFFVNNIPVVALPRQYEAVSFGTDERTLEFQILALEETNMSMITCGIDVSGRISDFSTPVYLTVFKLPSPPTNVTVTSSVSTLVVNATWTLLTDEFEPLNYTVHVINTSTNSTISINNTTNQYLEFDNTTLFALFISNCNMLSFVRFRVSVHYAQSASIPCPRSEESEPVGFSDVSSAMSICSRLQNNSYHNNIMSNSGHVSQVYHGVQLVSTLLSLLSLIP